MGISFRKHMGIEDMVPELELQREGDQYLIRVFQKAGFKGGRASLFEYLQIVSKGGDCG